MSSRLIEGRRLDRITQEVRKLKKVIGVMLFVLTMVFCAALIWSPVLLIDDFKTVLEFVEMGGALAFALEEFATAKIEKYFFE